MSSIIFLHSSFAEGFLSESSVFFSSSVILSIRKKVINIDKMQNTRKIENKMNTDFLEGSEFLLKSLVDGQLPVPQLLAKSYTSYDELVPLLSVSTGLPVSSTNATKIDPNTLSV